MYAYTRSTEGCGTGQHAVLAGGRKLVGESGGCISNRGCWPNWYYRCCRPPIVEREEEENEFQRLLANAKGSFPSVDASTGSFNFLDSISEMIVEVGARDGRDFHFWLEGDARRIVISFEPLESSFVNSTLHVRQIMVRAAVAPKEAATSSPAA